ncbi:hypothetical protein [Micromonospora matsumotoense]|uniref:hypothetical protein n=1 Tax=Micromonospora matsumotoense TaxID=121616 RepID=UPI0033ED6EB5
MNQDKLLTRLHATIARDLGGLLDIDAGLREALVSAQYTHTLHDLDLDIEAGLRAITPPPEAAAAPSPVPHSEQPIATPGRSDLQGAVAARLMSMDSPSRLTVRSHPAILAFALILEILNAVVTNRVIDHAFDLGFDSFRVLDLVRDRDNALNRARELVRELARGRSRARSRGREFLGVHTLGWTLDHAREIARTSALDRDLALALASALSGARRLARKVALGLDRDLDHDLACDLDLTLDLTPTPSHDLDLDHLAYVRRLDHNLDHARHNFTGADFSDVDLSGVALIGVRWSMATRWPSDEWRAQALLDSRDLGDGTYEIRGGSTNVPTHST